MHPTHIYLGVYYIGQQCQGESPHHSSTKKVHQFIPKVPASFPAATIGMAMRPLARGIKQNTHEHITYQIFNGEWSEETGCQIYLNSYDSIVLDFVNKNTQKCDVATVDNVLLDTHKAENSKHGNRGILKTIMNIKTSENYDQLLAKLVDHQEKVAVAKKGGGAGSDNSLDVETVKRVQMLEFLLNEQQNVRKPADKIENLNDVNAVLQKHEQNITAAGVLSLISGNTTFQVEYIKQMKIRKLLKIDEAERADKKNSFREFRETNSAGFTQQQQQSSSGWRPLGLNLE